MRYLVIQLPNGQYHAATLSGGQMLAVQVEQPVHAYCWKPAERDKAEHQAQLVGGTVVDAIL